MCLEKFTIYISREKFEPEPGFKCLHVKVESIWHLSFEEERLNMNWNGNLDSSIGKNARLVIWRSEVQIPVQVHIFFLKSKLLDLWQLDDNIHTQKFNIFFISYNVSLFHLVSCSSFFTSSNTPLFLMTKLNCWLKSWCMTNNSIVLKW